MVKETIKTIRHIVEFKFLRGVTSGVLYEKYGEEMPTWQDADEVIITIPPPANAKLPDLLRHIISFQDTMDIFVPSQPITCEVQKEERKLLFKCDL